jgi:uncharacterized NAD(P)/FAD-binding protein YdhS
MSHQERTLIVGGGASGVITAIALARAGLNPATIDIAEPRELLGEGLAYQTRDPLHRLNVPTGRMSAIEELPNDFAEWSAAPAYSFMERRTYSTYLRERLGKGVTHIRESVINLDPKSDDAIQATFAAGTQKIYTSVVLAMGHGAARLPDFLKGVPDTPRIIKDVWDGRDLPKSHALLCFGTGLTFIDIAMTHLSRDPHYRVIAISGSGNLPERHVQSPIIPLTPTVEDVSTLSKLREYLSSAGENWREAVDGLRPITEAMWRGFTTVEREEFLRTEGSAWSRRRHRIAPDIAEHVDAEIASGRITIVKGRVTRIDFTETEVMVDLEDGNSYTGDDLAICIGREYQLSDPLSTSLIQEGLTSTGPLKMGLSVDVTAGNLLKVHGSCYPQIYAIGPLRSGEAFESTAIPEIRKQSSVIARQIVENSVPL